MKNLIFRIAKIGIEFFLFTRMSVLGFSVSLVIIGALTVKPIIEWQQIILLAAVATVFHFFAYVSNDVVDLRLDRTASPREVDPLVRGVISPRLALIFALIQIPIALLLTMMLGAGRVSYLILFGAFLLMAVYNVFGKRLSVPVVMDLDQGLSWALLLMYGVFAVEQVVSVRVLCEVLFVILYIILINGVHGSIRDIKSDIEFGVKSTAILFGARYIKPDTIHIPLVLKLYTGLLHVILIGLTFFLIVGQGRAWNLELTLALSIVSFLSLMASILLIRVVSQSRLQTLVGIGTVHALLLLLSMIIAALSLEISWQGILCVVAALVTPMIVGGWLLPSLRITYSSPTRFQFD